MNPAIGIALLLTVLQVASGQKVTRLTACLTDNSLRLDCYHENKTVSSMLYEFSLTRDLKKHVLSGTIGVPEHAYRSRTKVTDRYNMKVLYLSSFTSKDEGMYTCEVRVSSQHPSYHMNVTVYKDKLVKCEGISLLAQSPSWLLLPLLALPVLQAADFLSL